MNIKRVVGLILAILALAAFVVPASTVATDDTNDPSVYFRPAVRFGTDDRTLYILDFLVPVYRGNKDLLFINTKFTPDDHTAWETNLGVGYRRLVLDDKLVLGGNLFYDHRKTRYGSHFDQLGLGFEAMAEPGGIGLATRINYYQPLTKAKIGEDFGYSFYSNGIYTSGIEEPMTGFDYEAGVRIPGISNYVETWAYAGGYHFFGRHVKDVNGVSARIEAMPTDFLRLNFEFRNDTVNHDQYYGEVAFEVPFSIENLVSGKNPFEGIGDVLTGSRTLKERMTEPVHRDVDIVVAKDYLTGPDAAKHGTFMEGVVFVADTGSDATGDGSFENPYYSLAAAETAAASSGISIIHVMAGDGTGIAGETFGQDGITIWGAGGTYSKYPYVANLVRGWPLITSTLTMNAQNMTVLGLSFDNPGDYAVVIDSGAAGAGLSILNNRIDVTGICGIYGSFSGGLGAAGEPAVISGNAISIDSSGFDAYGIYFEISGDTYADILNNRLEGLARNSDVYGIRLIVNDGDFSGSISNNVISGLASPGTAGGIYMQSEEDFAGSISGNTIINLDCPMSVSGIYAAALGDFNGSISGNTIAGLSGSSGTGIVTLFRGDFTGSISGNTIADIVAADGAAGGIIVNNPFLGGDFTGSISGNTIAGISGTDGAHGISAYLVGGAFAGPVSGNTISDVSGADDIAYGIYLEAYGGDIAGDVSDNTISYVCSNSSAYGIYEEATVLSGAGGYSSGSISGNTITGIESVNDSARGIYTVVRRDFSGSISRNTIAGIWSQRLSASPIDGYPASGIMCMSLGAFTGDISDNTLSDIYAGWSAHGIYLFVNSTFDGPISGNTISGVTGTNEATGILIDSNFWGSTVSISDNVVSPINGGNTAYGIYLGNSYTTSIVCSVTGNNLGVTGGLEAYGLYVQAYDGPLGTAATPLVFSGNSGTIHAPTAYVAYLLTNHPEASNVWIGSGKNGMGDNDFVSSSIWSGNYPDVTGSIWAQGYPTYHYIHP